MHMSGPFLVPSLEKDGLQEQQQGPPADTPVLYEEICCPSTQHKHLLPCRILGAAPSSFASAGWHGQEQIFKFAISPAQERSYDQTDLMNLLLNLKVRSPLHLWGSHQLLKQLVFTASKMQAKDSIVLSLPSRKTSYKLRAGGQCF